MYVRNNSIPFGRKSLRVGFLVLIASVFASPIIAEAQLYQGTVSAQLIEYYEGNKAVTASGSFIFDSTQSVLTSSVSITGGDFSSPPGISLTGGISFGNVLNLGTTQAITGAGSYSLIPSNPYMLEDDPVPYLNPDNGCCWNLAGTQPGGTVDVTTINACSWSTPTPGTWSDGTKWNIGVSPVSSVDAYFNTGSSTPYSVTLTGASAAGNLNVQGDNVTLNTAGNTVTLSGAVSVGSGAGGNGSLAIYSAANGSGGIIAPNGVGVLSGSTLSGNATIVANVTNAGNVAPGGASPGVLSVSGNYSQTAAGSLSIAVNGPASAQSNFGALSISGTASLAGTLSLSLGTGFTPSIGNSYTIVSASGISGTFNKGSNLVAAGPGFFKVNYQSSSVKIQPTDVITFYDEYPSSTSALDQGHGFLKMTSISGASNSYGFYPYISGVPYNPGYVNNDVNTPWNYSIAFPVSQSTFNSVYAALDSYILNTPTYSLKSFNCVDFIQSIAAVASLQLPNTIGRYGISDPLAFGLSLISIGNGNTSPGGGTVSFNSSTPAQPELRPADTPSGATPNDYSYSNVEVSGHTSPSALATALGLPLDQVNLGTVNSNSTTGLSVDISGADPTEDVISINWGDGSEYEGQSLAFSHIYASGTYSADLLEVDDGAVHSYDMTVSVSSALSTPVDVDVTAFSPAEDVNPGLIPAQLQPVPEPTGLLITSGSALVLLLKRRRV
jgi:hypothetical protein